jgi:S-adenosylmethionine decarboxylase
MSQPNFAPGKHVLLDFYKASHLCDADFIKTALQSAANACGATVLNIQVHSFGEGQGITGVALLAESHISIHTWPETHFAAIDIFMCGDCDPEQAITPLEQSFTPQTIDKQVYSRGGQTDAGLRRKIA